MSQPDSMLLELERSAFFDALAGLDEGDLGDLFPGEDEEAITNPASVWERKPTITARKSGGKASYAKEDVIELQKTLNVVNKPSVPLVADGDFVEKLKSGKDSATLVQVKLFQSMNNLSPSGVVDAAMWSALQQKLTPEQAAAVSPDAQAATTPAKKKKGKALFDALKKFGGAHGADILKASAGLLSPKLTPASYESEPITSGGSEGDEKKGWSPLMIGGAVLGGVVVLGLGIWGIKKLTSAPAPLPATR